MFLGLGARFNSCNIQPLQFLLILTIAHIDQFDLNDFGVDHTTFNAMQVKTKTMFNEYYVTAGVQEDFFRLLKLSG